MKTTISIRDLFRGLCVALAVMLTLVVLARAEETTPPPAAAPAEKAAPATPAEPAVPAETEKSELRRLDSPAAEKADAPAQDENEKAGDERPAKPAGHRIRGYTIGMTRGHHGDRTHFGADTRIGSDETVNGDVVAIMGNVVVDGIAKQDAIAVMGDNTINGSVQGDAVAVMGDATINGPVHGDVVAVMGDVVLGPKAVVSSDVTCVGGTVRRSPGAIVKGDIFEKDLGERFHGGVPFIAWWTHGLMFGRFLAFGPHLAWLWASTMVSLACYALLALLFPAGIRKCGDTLIERPILTVLTGLLSLISLPLLCVLMIITIVGIILLPFVPVVLVLFTLFGKASICALIGRLISRDRLHPALAVLVGGMVLVFFYLMPFVGLALALVTSFLGFSCVMCRLFSQGKKPDAPATPPVAAAAVPPLSANPPVQAVAFAAPVSSEVSGVVEPPPVLPPIPPVLPSAFAGAVSPLPLIPQASLPRAGFWRRMGALFIDFILIGIIFGPTGAGPAVIPFLAVYAAILWALKGTTVGGVIFGLKVVRLDERPMDWPTATVRALGCFLSGIVAGLGFIWIAFDREKQSWHDKIAGTVVVIPPKGTSLI